MGSQQNQIPELIKLKDHPFPFAQLMKTETFPIKSIYVEDQKGIHGWFGHQEEQKLFICLSGRMRILMTKLDDWQNPSLNLHVIEQVLVNDDPRVLFVPSGYVTAVQQLAEDGKVIVFSSISAKEFEASGKTFPSSWWYFETFM